MSRSDFQSSSWTFLGRLRGLAVITIAVVICLACLPFAHAGAYIPPQQSDDQKNNHWVVPVVIIGAVIAVMYLMYPPATPTQVAPPGLIPF